MIIITTTTATTTQQLQQQQKQQLHGYIVIYVFNFEDENNLYISLQNTIFVELKLGEYFRILILYWKRTLIV
jgi:hypothetical protein